MKIKLATQEQLENVKSKTFENMLKKQDKLTAGDNITIDPVTNTISGTAQYDDTLLLQEIKNTVSSLRTSIDKAVYADGGKLYRDRLEFREGNPWAVRDEVGVQIKDGGYAYTLAIKDRVKLSFKAQGDSAKGENIFIWADDGTGEDKYIAKVSDRTGLYSCVLDVVNDVKISTLGAPGVTFKFWDFEVEFVAENILDEAKMSNQGVTPLGDNLYEVGAGVALHGKRFSRLLFEKNTDYVISFMFENTDLAVDRFGFHAGAYTIKKVVVDGKEFIYNFGVPPKMDMTITQEPTRVDVYFTSKELGGDDSDLYIQPNRHKAIDMPIKYRMYDFILVEGTIASEVRLPFKTVEN